jgi:hypothetical protein
MGLDGQRLGPRKSADVLEVARAPGPTPQVVIVVAGDEPDAGGDGRVGCARGEGHHQMGERGCGLLGRAKRQLEHVAEYDQLGWVSARAQRA